MAVQLRLGRSSTTSFAHGASSACDHSPTVALMFQVAVRSMLHTEFPPAVFYSQPQHTTLRCSKTAAQAIHAEGLRRRPQVCEVSGAIGCAESASPQGMRTCHSLYSRRLPCAGFESRLAGIAVMALRGSRSLRSALRMAASEASSHALPCDRGGVASSSVVASAGT